MVFSLFIRWNYANLFWKYILVLKYVQICVRWVFQWDATADSVFDESERFIHQFQCDFFFNQNKTIQSHLESNF